MTKRRVLAINPSGDLYGSDLMFLRTLKGLRSRGFCIGAVLAADGPLRARLTEEDFSVATLALPVLRKSELGIGRLLLLPLQLLVGSWRILRQIRAQRFDMVYVNTITVPAAVMAARMARTPVVIHVRELEDGSPALIQWLLLQPVRLATTVVCNSEATRAWVVRNTGRRDAKVVLNGLVDCGIGHQQQREESYNVLLIGRLTPRKGQDIAIRAWALAARPADSKLFLAGDGLPAYRDYELDLHRLVESLHLGDSVIFLGYCNRPLELAARCALVVVPSRMEPFGNVAVESLAVGTPVIASDVGGLSEIVRDGETGILVPVGSADALALALTDLLGDHQRRAAYGKRGAEDVAKRFGTQRYLDEVAVCVTNACEGTVDR